METSTSHVFQTQVKEILGLDLSPLETLLTNFDSSQPLPLQSHAQTLLTFCKTHYPNSLSLKLAFLLRFSHRIDTRLASATLLRRLLTPADSHLWPRLPKITQNEIKSILLASLPKEYSRKVAKILCNLISDIGLEIFPRNEWPELLDFLFRSLGHDSFGSQLHILQESALVLFSNLSPKLGDIDIVFHRVDLLHLAFLKSMDSSCASHVRVAAFKASVNLVVFLITPSSYDRFQDFLFEMVKTVFELINMEQHEYAQSVLEDLIVLAATEPGFLRVHVATVVDSMLKVAEKVSLEEKTRQLGIEFVITLAEEREQGCGMVRKLPHLIIRLLSLLMKMLAVIEDDSSWHIAETDEDNAGETSVFCYGMESLSRIAIALPENMIETCFPDLLPEYLASPEWQKRHAAVIALAVIAGECSKALKQNLGQLVGTVLKFIRDPHPRVRWAATNAIMEFSKYLGPELQDQHHQQLLPALTTAMNDFQNPRVQVHSASAMLFFSKQCTPKTLTPYLNVIVSKLLKCLQKGKRMLKEESLAALASVASSSQEHFQAYYDTVMPYLKVIMMSSTDKYNRMLLGKSIECITMVGMAVGKEKFSNDVQMVVQVLMSLQESRMETDDPIKIFALQAWGRFCKCLGQEFLPYMGVAMPCLIQSAKLKTHVTSLSSSSVDFDELDNESTKSKTLGCENIEIKNHVLEEKAVACNVLCCCAAELVERLHLWIDEVAHSLVPLLKFNLHEEVKMAAVSAMPLILHSAKSAVEKRLLQGFNESPVKKLSDDIIPALVDALRKEAETEICARILDSLNECIQISGPLLNKTQTQHVLNEITELLTASSFKKTEREKRGKAEDVDAGELEFLKEEYEKEEKLYDKVGDCLSTLIKTYKAPLLPFFDKLLSRMALMWCNDPFGDVFLASLLMLFWQSVNLKTICIQGNNKTAKERRIAFRIFYDVSKECREEAFRYYEPSLPILFKVCNDKNPEIRQIAACGIGVCAEFGGSVFKPLVRVALSSIHSVLKHPKALHPDNVKAYDAAVSAFGKICWFHRDNFNAAEVVPAWLIHLPIKNDLNEAKIVHDQLCSMVEMSDKELLGPENINLPKIFAVFAEVLWAGNNLATVQTCNRIIKQLKHFQQILPPTTWASILSSLQSPQRNLLQSILSP